MTDADVDGSHIRTLLLTFFFRHMQELIKRNNVYIAQPPLFGIRKGEVAPVHQERARVREGDGEAGVGRAGGAVWRGRGEAGGRGADEVHDGAERVSGIFRQAESAAARGKDYGTAAAAGSREAGGFEGEKKAAPKKIEKLEKELKRLQKDLKLKSVEMRFDEEHNLWEVMFVNSQGAEHVINWELAATPEGRQLISKFKQIAEYLEPPFVVESLPRVSAKGNGDAADEAAEAEGAETEVGDGAKGEKKSAKPARRAKEPEIVEKATARELFDYVLNEGRREYTVQRYKGLGEMTAEQLWETTMDPERRTLLSVRLEDLAETETIFTTLMGEDVEGRRKFIEENALDVKNLDI